jgi:hypothetical protein
MHMPRKPFGDRSLGQSVKEISPRDLAHVAKQRIRDRHQTWEDYKDIASQRFLPAPNFNRFACFSQLPQPPSKK